MPYSPNPKSTIRKNFSIKERTTKVRRRDKGWQNVTSEKNEANYNDYFKQVLLVLAAGAALGDVTAQIIFVNKKR